MGKNIVITGATSGLGKALAIAYAAHGVRLFLFGRNASAMEEISKLCQARGAVVQWCIADVRDKEAMERHLNEITTQCEVDLVIANAGISASTAQGLESAEQTRQVFATNLDGVLNTLLPLIPVMKQAKGGQIAIVSSLASYVPLPSCPAYSASKAAVRFYAEALRGVLAPYNVGVTAITPGYIKTPLTDVNTFPMPFLMSAEKAADIIKTRLRSNPCRIAFPFALYAVITLLGMLPKWMVEIVVNKLPRK